MAQEPERQRWTRDEVVEAFRAHGPEIREADEWRPLAQHVLDLVEIASADRSAEVVIGLLEVARHVMPDTFWSTDSRVQAARELLGDRFPSDDTLAERFEART